MGKGDMKLFWGSGSGPCWKVMIALAEKGFGDIEKKLISFSEKGHKGPDVMALNPRGQVPTFKDGDIVVNESMAICLYLEKAYSDSGTSLVPSAPAEFAKVYQMAIEAQENLQMKISLNCIYYQWMTPKEKKDDETLDKNFKAAKDELAIWEERLKKSGGEYICGKNFTLADVVLFTFVAVSLRFGSELSDYPSLKAYYAKLKERPSIKETWPPHWNEGELEDGKKILKRI